MNSLIIKVNAIKTIKNINKIIEKIVRLIKSNYVKRNKKQYASLVYRRGDKIPIDDERRYRCTYVLYNAK